MQINELKENIERGNLDNSLIIFKYTDTPFIAYQYIYAIGKLKNKQISFINDLSPFMGSSMFYMDTGKLSVYICDKLAEIPYIRENLFIITKDCLEESSYIVEIPKLESWQLRDYAYTICHGCESKYIDRLLAACGKDIFKLDMELSKIKIFSEKEQKKLIVDLYENKQLADNLTQTIFDFTTAVINKDIPTLLDIYKNISDLDIEPLGVVTILYKNLRNMILVGFQNSPTEQNTGLKSNQIYAIRNSLRGHTVQEILNIFDTVSSIDFKLKNGELPANMILDYTVLKCLSA